VGDAPFPQRMRRWQGRVAALHGMSGKVIIGASQGRAPLLLKFRAALGQASDTRGLTEVAKRPVVHRENAVSRAKEGGFRRFL
jgi:hypothetical protein